tara:strand:- start:754 stop:987 length:234 start_codon:yes stop_codon:yes gene_type:complete
MIEDPARLIDPPHFTYLYLEEIHEMEDRAKELLKQAELYHSNGKTKEAEATEFVAKTYTATAEALMRRAMSEPLAVA